MLLAAVFIANSMGFPTNSMRNTPEKIVAIVPLDREDLKPAETFYSGYSSGYPSLGVTTFSGWRGDHQNGYGAGYGVGVGAGYGAGYGGGGYPVGYGGGYGNVGGGVGGSYGWKTGPNRWAV
ncbi:hypothetical protein NQ314_012275 [Rhamnusium bicolor]|uniref:Uncharacterized protein n=1 Tax=Rhamnusium bicolor TaxID=1586634 RepID=A0AAV8XCW8_9CUCU|nr:hypothetical protein NQ314_012275 [Rhamnusium bicolor]